MSEMKERLIKSGVLNLKGFGYPKVTPENILTDKIYKAFFKSMLEDCKGRSPNWDGAIDDLLKEIASE